MIDYFLKTKHFQGISKDLSFQEKTEYFTRISNMFYALFSPQKILKFVTHEDMQKPIDQMIEKLSKIPIGKCFDVELPTKKYFKCLLFEENFAWIDQSRKGHCRYFTKNGEHQSIGLDLIDLLEFYFQKEKYRAIYDLFTVNQLTIEDNVWRKNQINKYQRNAEWIYQLSLTKRTFPCIYQMISRYIDVFQFFLSFGKNHVYKKDFSFEGEHVFFVSTRYLESQFPFLGQSTINRLINLLASLGFIRKIPKNLLPKEFFSQTEKNERSNNLQNYVNYYCVYDFSFVSEEAETRAKKLLENGISLSNITESRIREVLGNAVADQVYIQIRQKNKRIPERKRENIEDSLEQTFLNVLQKYGFVTKSMVIQSDPSPLNKKNKSSYLNQIWKSLCIKHHCLYKKPTKEVKKKYQLTSNEYLAFQKNLEEI